MPVSPRSDDKIVTLEFGDSARVINNDEKRAPYAKGRQY